MTFSRPEYLWLLTLVAWAALGCLLAGRRRRRLRFPDTGRAPWPALARTSLFLGGLLFLALSAAGPRWGLAPTVPAAEPGRLVVALDCSNSMLARDMVPDRLSAAKALVRAVLARLPQLRVGLVTFAGRARLACPITADRAGLLAFLDAASPARMPLGGTAPADALEAGRLALLGGGPGAILLVSDGETTVESPDTDQTGQSPPVCTVAVGGALPVTIPGPDGGLLRDAAGRPVQVAVDVAALAALARHHGGQAFRLSPDGPSPDAALATALAGLLPTTPGQDGPERPADRTALCLTLALVLLSAHLLLTPPGRIACLALVLLPVWTAPARAATTAAECVDQGLSAFAQGRSAQARDLFLAARARNPDAPEILYDLGTAYYRLADYAKAARYFDRAARTAKGALRTRALYNQGNAVFRQGDYVRAVALYQSVLNARPADDAAKANLDIARTRLEAARRSTPGKSPAPDAPPKTEPAALPRESDRKTDQPPGPASQGRDDPANSPPDAQAAPETAPAKHNARPDRKAGAIPLAARQGAAGGPVRTSPDDQDQEPLLSRVPDLPGLPVIDPTYARPRVEKDW